MGQGKNFDYVIFDEGTDLPDSWWHEVAEYMGQAKRKRDARKAKRERRMAVRTNFFWRLGKALISFFMVALILPMAVAVAIQSFQDDQVIP